MNVRFSDQALRCRVNRLELERLLTGRSVALEVILPRDHVFRVNVRPTTMSAWQLDSDPTGVWLTIPRAELEELSSSLPSKEGIEEAFPTSTGGVLSVSFEVDVKRQTPG
jgi:hypothetical protein